MLVHFESLVKIIFSQFLSCYLRPVKDQLESEHDKVVAVLNQALADRAKYLF